MKAHLIEQPTYNSALVQVLHNRGVKDIKKYLDSTMEDVNEPAALGSDRLSQGARMLMTHVSAEDDILVVIDADCDGFTSSALLINYLHDCFPSFVENHIKWFLHDGKNHGLHDCVDIAKNFKIVVLPDSSSNDYDEHKTLKDLGIDILVLDHHEADHISPDAIIINNQLSDYPNKELSGVGVTWQFCRYLDTIGGNNYANNYLDLVALGNMGDMMSMTSIETKTLIFEGFKERNIKNPFIYEMAQKNSFPLSKADYKPSANNGLQFSPMGAAFFIVPFVNAIVRSGTMEEKELIFQSMLQYKAFEMILSNKRGHKLGEQERRVDQAIRTCTNVKNRQTRAEEAGLEHLEGLIIKNNMMDHKVLLFLLEPGEVDRNIAGLVANKFMSKYQRPVCVLTKVEDTYQGSARGYGSDMMFKDICVEAPGCTFAEGHQGAFGLGLRIEDIDNFLTYTDEVFKNLSSEPSYSVDYVWDYNSVDGEKILEMADVNDYLGKDIERPLVYIKNIKINNNNFKVMKSNTVKINLPTVDLIKFQATEDEIEKFSNENITIDVICKPSKNEWNFQVDPQLIIMDYNILEGKQDLLERWGF